MGEDTIPVTVLSGTLGAGKTTLLNHLLAESDERDIAVLVNDMGEVNVDADLVAESSDISKQEEELIELSNGCICCELRGDLLDAVGTLTSNREFDAVVIESTGVAEPLPVAQTLTMGFDQSDLNPTEFYEETGIEPMADCHLDTTVTVVDAHQFDEAMDSDAVLDDDGTDKHLGDLLVEQVEFCDVLVLNKCDLVDESTLAEIEETLQRLQPRAKLVRTEHSVVNPDELIGTGRFSFEEASQSAGWIRELEEPHASAEEEHGVSSLVFHSRRPFHPERFASMLDAFPDSIVRSKGHFWLAGREERALSLSVAGQSVRVGPGGRWVATLPEAERQEQFEANPVLEELWDENWGDRGTQLVVIGREMDHQTVRERFEDCLLTDEEMGERWERYEDRFPQFDLDKQAAQADPEEGTDAQGDTNSQDEAEELGIAG